MEYLLIKYIDSTSAMGRKQKFDKRIDSESQSQLRAAKRLNTSSDGCYLWTFKCMWQNASNAVINSIILQCTCASLPGFPQSLQLLHQPEYVKLDHSRHGTSSGESNQNPIQIKALVQTPSWQDDSLKDESCVPHCDGLHAFVKSRCYSEVFLLLAKKTWVCKDGKSAKEARKENERQARWPSCQCQQDSYQPTVVLI